MSSLELHFSGYKPPSWQPVLWMPLEILSPKGCCGDRVEGALSTVRLSCPAQEATKEMLFKRTHGLQGKAYGLAEGSWQLQLPSAAVSSDEMFHLPNRKNEWAWDGGEQADGCVRCNALWVCPLNLGR